MPTETFENLSEEKKLKIIEAAKKEFSRVQFEDTSIKNIVKEAGIARGSFYQYFNSKRDLLEYIIYENKQRLEKFIKKTLKDTNGDIFDAYIKMYDYILNKIFNEENKELYKRIIESLKVEEENFLLPQLDKKEINGPFKNEEIVNLINKDLLNIENQEDLDRIIKVLFLITRSGIILALKNNDTKKAKSEYIKMIDYIKYGALKRKREEVK